MGKHFERGMMLYHLGRWREAVDAFTSALSNEEHTTLAFVNRGAALIRLQRYRDAERDLREALSRSPDFAAAHYNLSIALANRGQLEQAEKAALESLRLERDADYFLHLGMVEFELRRYAKTLEATSNALAVNPQHVDTLVFRARVLTYLGKSAEATELLRDALSIAPESPSAQLAMGTQALRGGMTQKALPLLLEARRLDPLTHHDRTSIAAAYGRMSTPFRQISPLLIRLDRLSSLKQWLLWTAVGTGFIIARLKIHPTVGNPPTAIVLVFVALANYLVLGVSVDQFATTYGKLVWKRDLQVRWYSLVPEVFRILIAQLIQLIATLLGLASAYGPPNVVSLILLLPMNIRFLMSVNAQIQIWRIFAAFVWLFVVILAWATSIALMDKHTIDSVLPMWGVAVLVSFVSTLLCI